MSNLEHHYKVYPEILLMIKLTVFFQESDGLLKRGRELEHYPYHDSVPNISYDKCSVVDTEYGGIPCRLKVGFFFSSGYLKNQCDSQVCSVKMRL